MVFPGAPGEVAILVEAMDRDLTAQDLVQ